MPNAKAFPFKMGADPEFNFTIQNKQTSRLRADNLMKDFFKDKSSSNMGFEIEGGNAGWDGSSATGELRPKPEKSPAKLAANLGAMYKEITKRGPRAIKMSILSTLAPVGGHIHFELDTVSKAMSDQKARQVCKRLSTFYIPLMLGENKQNTLVRMQTSYGKFSDWRREGGPTYEYRTPSAEWQTTPKIAEATLAYMGTVWYEAVHKPLSFRGCKAVYNNDRMGDALQGLVAREYDVLNDAIVKELKSTIKTFKYYEMFKEEIDYILDYKKVLADKQKAEFCINKGWELNEEVTATKKTFNNEVIINKQLKDMDIDRWLNLFNIPFNPETNVGDFVDALKKRILAFDWSMKNDYFMFGMRKGIEKPIVLSPKGFVVGSDQIKTQRDLDCVTETFDRMRAKIRGRSAAGETFIIGLPYSQRMERNVRPVMELIYELEKMPEKFEKVMTPNKHRSDLVNDCDSEKEEWGKIAQAYSTSDATNDIVDHNAAPRFAVEDEIDYDEEDYDECSNCGAPHGDCDC